MDYVLAHGLGTSGNKVTNGKYMLAHVAYREAEVAINNIAGVNDMMDYRAVPGIIYTSPEVAYAGMSKLEAKGQYAHVAVTNSSINMSGRHVAEYGQRRRRVADKRGALSLYSGQYRRQCQKSSRDNHYKTVLMGGR